MMHTACDVDLIAPAQRPTLAPAPPALPDVHRQPSLRRARRHHVDVDVVLRHWIRAHLRQDALRLARAQGSFEHEFGPLIQWALDSWDYLLTTEGCRFLLRTSGERVGVHGDYRVCTWSDFHRIVVHGFRACLVAFIDQAIIASLAAYLQQQLWPVVRARYQALDQPVDGRQRRLTAYSYLRCVPYRFLNAYHEVHVTRAVAQLSRVERRVVALHFLHFFTPEAVARETRLRLTICQHHRQRALRHLAQVDRLSYALLLQIERY